MLKEHFDLIVGNPPWLSYRYIADPDYQAEVKQRAVVEYAIAPKSQKLMTQMELCRPLGSCGTPSGDNAFHHDCLLEQGGLETSVSRETFAKENPREY